MDYIKRVVGLPGDEVAYVNQKLCRINGSRCRPSAQGEFYDEESLRYAPQFSEKLGEVEHRILVDPRARPTTAPIPRPSRSPRTAATAPRA
jgi:signal peptidase I